jgi:hypothetical protein
VSIEEKDKTKSSKYYEILLLIHTYIHSTNANTLFFTRFHSTLQITSSSSSLKHTTFSLTFPGKKINTNIYIYMGLSRNSLSQPEIDDAGGSSDVGFSSIRGRFPFKRNPNHIRDRQKSFSDRQLPRSTNTTRSHLHNRFTRKGLLSLFPFFKGKSGFYALIFAVVFLFALASMVMQSSITSVFRQHNERNRDLRDDLKFGSSLKFVPGKVSQRFLSGDGLDRLRSQPRIGVRAPRIALVSSVNFLLFQ